MESVPVFTQRFVVSGYRDRRSLLELLAAGQYGNVTRRVIRFIEDLDREQGRRAAARDVVDLEYVELPFDPKTPDVYTELTRLGLHPPTAEDALRFGERYPNEQMEGPIAFLHTPWVERGGALQNVLCLDSWNGKRTLRGPSILHRWPRNHRFIGRRR